MTTKKSKKQQGGVQQQRQPTEVKKRRGKGQTGRTDGKPPEPAPAQVPPRPPQQADDSDAIVVFAIRLSRSERDLIHEAAGPAKASKFVKGIALAAARGDREALEEIWRGIHANTK